MANASDQLTAKNASSAMGAGSAELTIRLKKAYDQANMDAQTNGQSAPGWPAWLESQGYGLDGNGLVFKRQ